MPTFFEITVRLRARPLGRHLLAELCEAPQVRGAFIVVSEVSVPIFPKSFPPLWKNSRESPFSAVFLKRLFGFFCLPAGDSDGQLVQLGVVHEVGAVGHGLRGVLDLGEGQYVPQALAAQELHDNPV